MMNAVSGRVIIYRVFDIGQDVNLEMIQKKFLSEKNPQRFKLSKSSRAMIINNAPLALNIDGGRLEILGVNFEYEAAAKIWHFGAVSISIHLKIPSDLNWEKLIELASFLENDDTLHHLSIQHCTHLLNQIDSQRLGHMNWETFEDYTIFFFKNLPGVQENALTVFQQYNVPGLILAQKSGNLSDQVKKAITDGAMQFNQNDLAVINWDSAFIIEPSDSLDIADVIEFALCQLLEMRHYDDLLDDKLASLYTTLEKKYLSIWESSSEKMSKEAAQKYLEVSETIENVENSLKVVGDFYFAQIFRTALNRFRFNDWRESVNNKLENLATISNLLTSEINERRSRLLEVVIIVLIAIEVIPFLIKLVIHP